MISSVHIATRQIQALVLVREKNPRRPDIIVPLRRIAARRNLELRATGRRAVRSVEAHRIIEDLDLVIREGPPLRICSGARLDLHWRAVGVRRRCQTEAGVVSRLDEHRRE